MSSVTRVIHYDDLPQGGFAGIVERQMVLNPQMWPDAQKRNDISHGLDDFIYLALGYFKPNDGAPLHPHKDVDIVSVVFNGSVGHKGTLGDGTSIHAPEVQVQRAGTGMQHSEFNLNDTQSDIAQIWFRPPEQNMEPAYKNFKLKDNQLTAVLGGNNDSFRSNMQCEVGFLASQTKIRCEQPFVALITQGEAIANDIPVSKGDLIEGNSLELVAQSKVGLALIQKSK